MPRAPLTSRLAKLLMPLRSSNLEGYPSSDYHNHQFCGLMLYKAVSPKCRKPTTILVLVVEGKPPETLIGLIMQNLGRKIGGSFSRYYDGPFTSGESGISRAVRIASDTSWTLLALLIRGFGLSWSVHAAISILMYFSIRTDVMSVPSDTRSPLRGVRTFPGTMALGAHLIGLFRLYACGFRS